MRVPHKISPTGAKLTSNASPAWRGSLVCKLSRLMPRCWAIGLRVTGACDERGVTFRWKDYRAHGGTRYKAMTLNTDEFMRRFLLHVLPSGFHRIRHYGLLANANRSNQIATARELLQALTRSFAVAVLTVLQRTT